MVDAYLTCPSTTIFPTLYGVAESKPSFGFDKCETYINSIDTYDKFVVAGGSFKCNTNPYGVFPDLTFDYCYDPLTCENTVKSLE